MKKTIAALAMSLAFQANAAQITYELPFLTTQMQGLAQTYTGTGYMGMYPSSWANLFGLEFSDYSRTIAQVDISALAGKRIDRAVLSFNLVDGDHNSQSAAVTGFDGGAGVLAYKWNSPASNYGSVTAATMGGANAIDITSLLAASVAGDDGWLGLHLRGTTRYQWTYAGPGNYSVDRANVRLSVDFADRVDVPEPASLALFGLGALGLAGARRRAKRLA